MFNTLFKKGGRNIFLKSKTSKRLFINKDLKKDNCFDDNFGSKRGFPAALRELERRRNGVRAVAKITNTMKLVAQARMSNAKLRAERTTPFFTSTDKLFKENHLSNPPVNKDNPDAPKKILTIAVTTDRGMCGSINSNLIRSIRNTPGAKDMNFVVIGEKGVASFEKLPLKDKIPFTIHTTGLKTLSFIEIGAMAEKIATLKDEYDIARITYTKFIGSMKFEIDVLHLPSPKLTLLNTDKIAPYEIEEVKYDLFQDLHEFHLATALNYTIYQTQASETASRRNAMDSANKNAQEVIQKLSIQFNKLRQSSITTELSEIVTGASVVQEKEN